MFLVFFRYFTPAKVSNSQLSGKSSAHCLELNAIIETLKSMIRASVWSKHSEYFYNSSIASTLVWAFSCFLLSLSFSFCLCIVWNKRIKRKITRTNNPLHKGGIIVSQTMVHSLFNGKSRQYMSSTKCSHTKTSFLRLQLATEFDDKMIEKKISLSHGKSWTHKSVDTHTARVYTEKLCITIGNAWTMCILHSTSIFFSLCKYVQRRDIELKDFAWVLSMSALFKALATTDTSE